MRISFGIKWWIGLVIILGIYSFYYLIFADNHDFFIQIPRKVRHLIKFGTTVSVYLIGTFHLGKIQNDWMARIWHLIHLSFLGILVLIGLYDWMIAPTPYFIRNLTIPMQEFLISPTLYVLMGLINKILIEGKNN